jgi:hypothetical protein
MNHFNCYEVSVSINAVKVFGVLRVTEPRFKAAYIVRTIEKNVS